MTLYCLKSKEYGYDETWETIFASDLDLEDATNLLDTVGDEWYIEEQDETTD